MRVGERANDTHPGDHGHRRHGTNRDRWRVLSRERSVPVVEKAAVVVERHGVPVVAVDTRTAVDLSSGEPSDPAVLADLTVTFHRPKTGLLTRRGARYAGKVLVAPIGIPTEADRG